MRKPASRPTRGKARKAKARGRSAPAPKGRVRGATRKAAPTRPPVRRRTRDVVAVLMNGNPEPLAARIRQRFPNLPLTIFRTYDEAQRLVAAVKPQTALAFKIGSAPFPRDAFLGIPTLKWIQASGAGIDHWVPWDPKTVTITNASGIHGDIMSHYTAWAILNHQLGLPMYAGLQARRQWNKTLHESASGKTLVVVGFGRIGEQVGRLAQAMGMRVLGVRTRPHRSPAADRVVGIDRLYEVLGEGDYVSCILPLTQGTRNLFDAKAFAAMKPGAYFVNTGRGRIVDETALLAALQSGRLSGALIDVFATEPLAADSPFWSMDNVVVLPHASGDAKDWQMRVAELFCDNLERWLAGKPLMNIVDPQRGY